ncbi:ABC transporter substrate-binding protein [Rhizobium sp. C4]|uniref:ABC transporter substrate-binding protein n=1 Tax=Rhizobium sp. C4 TaxID=1349800 RepID=UPI001E6512DE|nr:ABC transporter substrate-binding protein [Rhizobium sp. C4]MCD2175018.1 ABC transporter substrate-binding protein [Rhizobium sp. C4]
MKTVKRTLAIVSLLSGMVAGTAVANAADAKLNAMLPEKIKTTGVVRVASDFPFPPYEFMDKDNKLTGFEYDLSQAAGELLGVKFEWQKQPFDGILPGLAAGNYDLAWSSITDKTQRQKIVDFVDYAVGQGGILMKKGAGLKGKADLCGLKISTQKGGTGEKDIQDLSAKCVQLGKKAAEPVLYPSSTEAELAIKSGGADAMLSDAAGLAYIAQTVDGGKAYDFSVYTDFENPRFPLGVAVPKNNNQLRDAMQAALQALIDNGTYAKIMDKYDIKALSVDKITINAAIK